MLDPEFTLRVDFPPAGYDEWRALAVADLEGASFEQRLVTHTYEGIDIQPVRTAPSGREPRTKGGCPGKPSGSPSPGRSRRV